MLLLALLVVKKIWMTVIKIVTDRTLVFFKIIHMHL